MGRQNMERDNSVLGCGDGDVEKILTTGVLKANVLILTLSSLLWLAPAVFPAREIFGIRLGCGG